MLGMKNGLSLLAAAVVFALTFNLAFVVAPHALAQEILVPAGEFLMGCDGTQGSWSCYQDEDPIHAVSLAAFYIDTYEVTAAQYKACVDAGSCTAPFDFGANCTYDKAGKENHPVNCVYWGDATAYCAWKGKRLPTEAEWEKAARGTDQRIFPWGNQDPVCDVNSPYGARFNDYASCSYAGTEPVGSFVNSGSPYGAYDMAGNVREWINDWYYWDYYASSPGENPPGPPSGGWRVRRGGGWDDSSWSLRGTNRNGSQINWKPGSVGFRCAQDAGDVPIFSDGFESGDTSAWTP